MRLHDFSKGRGGPEFKSFSGTCGRAGFRRELEV
jgi:hypothetical protein